MDLISESVANEMNRVFINFKTKQSLIQLVKNNLNSKIVLLRNDNVINWIFGDLSFIIENTPKKDYKIKEDEWGRSTLKLKRPDLNLDKQWTNKFGDHIIEELFMLWNKPVYKPKNMNHLEPDLEGDEYIIEVKTQTYFTSGTASEKILGCPFKYADVPVLYNKPLKIVCMGGCEKALLDFGVVDCSSETKGKFLQFYRDNRIEFVSLKSFIAQEMLAK